MLTIDYLKLQAKNLFKEFSNKTHKYSLVNDPEFTVLCEYGYDENKFSLMSAQHIVAMMCGFHKWTDLTKASNEELEIGKLLYDNQHIITAEDWNCYILEIERANNITLAPYEKLQILKKVWLGLSHS